MSVVETFFSPTMALSFSMMAGVTSRGRRTSSTEAPMNPSSILLAKALVDSSRYLLKHLEEDLPPSSSALSARASTASFAGSPAIFTAAVLRSGIDPAMVPEATADSRKAARFLRGK